MENSMQMRNKKKKSLSSLHC